MWWRKRELGASAVVAQQAEKIRELGNEKIRELENEVKATREAPEERINFGKV